MRNHLKRQKQGSAAAIVTLAQAHGAFFMATGLWPVIHMKSFIAVTGPKVDLWLVKTVGLSIASIGLGLLASSREAEQPNKPMLAAAAACSAALAGVDLNYVAKGRIPKVYLLDFVTELGLLALWGGLLAKHSSPSPSRRRVPGILSKCFGKSVR